MAKVPNSVVGLDLGRYSLKSVVLQRRGKNLAVTHFGSYIPAEPAQSADALAKQLKTLFRDMGGSAKSCAVSVSSPDAIIRIIEQPETPTEILRDALRLNGMALLNQDVRNFVLDCDRIPSAQPASPAEPGIPAKYHYLVGGLPRTEVQKVGDAVEGVVPSVHQMQLAPIAVLNAFEVARPQVYNEGAFFLVDIGHLASTMMVGAKRELVLVRSVDFGGHSLIESLSSLSGDPRETVIAALDQEDEVMVEYTRVALNTVAREIMGSIGFFEHRREEAIGRVFVSGGPAKSRVFLRLMSEELGLPCEAWSAFEQCQIEVSADRRPEFEREVLDLNCACGAAAEVLNRS